MTNTLVNVKEFVGDFGLQILIFSVTFIVFVWLGFSKDQPIAGIVFGFAAGILLALSTIIVN